MNIDLNKVYKEGNLYLDEDIIIETKENNVGIAKVENSHLSGQISYLDDGSLILNLLFAGDMLLKDAITLDEISHHFESNIDEELNEDEVDLTNYIDKSKNILDISEILWQNIVLEVPIRVKKDDKEVSLSGEGWQLNKDNKEEIDPRLAKLAELLEDGKE